MYANTDYTRLKYNSDKNLSLVKLKLLTGRTHQIRVHMKYIGFPLIGDFLYNPDYTYMDRQALHSGRLEFIHPNTGKKIDLITGVSFAPILKEYAKKLEEKLGLKAEVHAIVNNFFGTSVTVAGLVTAGDIIDQLVGVKSDAFVIPDNMLREFTDTFLDNKTVKEVEDALGAPFIVVSHSGSDTAQKIVEHFENK